MAVNSGDGHSNNDLDGEADILFADSEVNGGDGTWGTMACETWGERL